MCGSVLEIEWQFLVCFDRGLLMRSLLQTTNITSVKTESIAGAVVLERLRQLLSSRPQTPPAQAQSHAQCGGAIIKVILPCDDGKNKARRNGDRLQNQTKAATNKASKRRKVTVSPSQAY
jgi:hypothetical protein